MKHHFVIFICIIILFLILAAYNLCARGQKYQDPLITKLRQDVLQLDPRIADLEFYSSDESYCEDKKRIYLCLRDENGEYYSYNMLMYVVTHELAHALSEGIDTKHVTPAFRNKFAELLQKAAELGIYDPSIPLVTHYCHVDL